MVGLGLQTPQWLVQELVLMAMHQMAQHNGNVWDILKTMMVLHGLSSGGNFGNNTNITEGDLVVFKFDVYKEYWGTYSFDALRVWIDTNQDGTLISFWYVSSKSRLYNLITSGISISS